MTAKLKNAGAFAGTYNHGTQQKNSDGTLYLNEKVPTQINADTVKEDGSVVDPGTVYIQRIILAPDRVEAATGNTAKLVANFERKTEEGSGIAQDEVGTTAGEIKNFYIWDGFNTDGESRLGSKPVTASELGSQSFYEELGFNANTWNYMGPVSYTHLRAHETL